MNNCCSPYGNFRTRTFIEIFTEKDKDTFDVFNEMFENSGIPLKISKESLSTIFYLLYANYGNSHIASSDENRFKYKLQSIIFMYGPTWEKRLEIQEKIRNLKEEELVKGGDAIYNSANAPGTDLAGLVNNEGKVDYLSGQNTTTYRKSKLEGYQFIYNLLETDVTKEFINKFRDLFIKIVQPQTPLWYITEENEND